MPTYCQAIVCCVDACQVWQKLYICFFEQYTDRKPKLQATSRRNQCPVCPARSNLSRRFCGIHHVRFFVMDRNYQEMFEAIDACYYKALIIPCLSLIYTVIDSIGWLAYGDKEESSKKRFVVWSEKYLLPHVKDDCTAIDLYSARCSILHGLSWESSLSQNHKARIIVYSLGRGTEKSSDLDKEIFSQKHVVSVHIDSLITSVKLAVADFFKDAEADASLMKRIKYANGKRYAKIRIEDYEKIVYSLMNVPQAGPLLP